jgi:hypothetical protein
MEKPWEVVWHVLFPFFGLAGEGRAWWLPSSLARARARTDFALAVSRYTETVLRLLGYSTTASISRPRTKCETETLRSAITGRQRMGEVANASDNGHYGDECEEDSKIELHGFFQQGL